MVQKGSAALEHEATCLARYIIGRQPSDTVLSLYAKALHQAPALTAREAKLLAFGLRHRWALGCIDGGLVFVDPHSEIRRRLYVLFAILESIPEYSGLFLPRQRSPWYLLYLGVVGIRAILRTITGLILIKALRA